MHQLLKRPPGFNRSNSTEIQYNIIYGQPYIPTPPPKINKQTNKHTQNPITLYFVYREQPF